MSSTPSKHVERPSAQNTARTPAPWKIGMLGVVIAALLAIPSLASFGWDVTGFAAFGVEGTETLEYAEERLGPVVTREGPGHDGKFFFVQANDPFHLNPQQHAIRLDRPAYRSQRMLYPLLAGGLGLFPPAAAVWGMLTVNILALGAGGWATAQFARDAGWSTWWGLAFVLNFGLMSEMNIGGGGVVAYAAAMWGLVALQREHTGWAAAGFTAAVLAREAMLLLVAGAAFWWWLRHRKVALGILVPPVAAAAGWAGYLRLRLGQLKPEATHIEEIGLPFQGFIGALELWPLRPANLVVGLTIAAILLVLTVRTVRSGGLLAWSAVGFVPLAIVLTRQVWFSYFDISRAMAPVLTAWVLVTFAGRHGRPEPD